MQKTYVIIGGTPRKAALTKIEKELGGTWEWVEARKGRQLIPLAQRLNAGQVDHLIILNRFISHAAIALLRLHVKRVEGLHYLERGYGVRELREVLGL